MDDIEDIFKHQNEIFITNPRYNSNVLPRFRKSKTKKCVEDVEFESNKDLENDNIQSFIPGTQKIFLKTWGCSHNNSDSEYMAGQLDLNGYKITESKEDANLWILNSCTVKNPAEDHFRNEIEAAKKAKIPIVVAGCVPQGAPKAQFLKGLSVVGVQQIDRIIEVVEETLKGNSVRLLSSQRISGRKIGGASLDLPKIRRNPLIEIISISTGCLNQCTYCKTKHARGDLGSYPIEEIVNRARQSFEEGVCEIWLTSEDTGAYGRDIGVTLPELLRKLCEVIPDGCKLRLGMTNPPYILDYLEEMSEILNDRRVYSFLHIPVQSGSNAVLSEMKREYTIEEFSNVVDTLRKKVPGITIATDIICGFPTETEADFADTLKLCQKYKFPSLFINQFYPRPGTPAAKMRRIPTKEVKNRSTKLAEFFHSYETYSEKIGEIQTILITEDSTDKKYWVGHNNFYDQVLIPKSQNYLGKTVKVKIVETGKHFLKGEPIDESISTAGIAAPLTKGEVSGGNGKNLLNLKKYQEIMRDLGVFGGSFIFLLVAVLFRFLWICFHNFL